MALDNHMKINSYFYMMESAIGLDNRKLEVVAHILKTVAHPTRIAIVHLLTENEELGVNEICSRLDGAEQSLVSHHLAMMHFKGILSRKKQGRRVLYSLLLSEVVDVINCIKNCKVPIHNFQTSK